MDNNEAIVTKLKKVRPHPNADRLQLAEAANFQVIVGLDNYEDELGLFFNSNLELSDEFLKANNLYRIKNPDGTYSGGLFEQNRRVKAVSVRAQKSYGFWCPLSYLDFLGEDIELKEGDSFNELRGVPICQKHVPLRTRKMIRQEVSAGTKSLPTFYQVSAVNKLEYNLDFFPKDCKVFITEKLHGTSQRTGNAFLTRKLSWLEKLAMRFGIAVNDQEWKPLTGTKNVILFDSLENRNPFYGGDVFRHKQSDSFKDLLHKGETVYYEIVGYTDDNKPIQPGTFLDESYKNVLGKELYTIYSNLYGDIHWTYDCPVFEAKSYVYDIAVTNIDGWKHHLRWDEVLERCRELGLQTVPELDRFDFSYKEGGRKHSNNVQKLLEYATQLADQPNTLNPLAPREGVVLRTEEPNGAVQFFKVKSFLFYVLEGIIKETHIDIEDIS